MEICAGGECFVEVFGFCCCCVTFAVWRGWVERGGGGAVCSWMLGSKIRGGEELDSESGVRVVVVECMGGILEELKVDAWRGEGEGVQSYRRVGEGEAG